MMMKVNIRTIVTLVVTFSACIISQDNVATAINIRGGDIDGLPPITALPKWCPEPSRLFISKHPDYDKCNGKLRKTLLMELTKDMDTACDHDFQDLQREIKQDPRCKKIFNDHGFGELGPKENLEETDTNGNIQYHWKTKPADEDIKYYKEHCDEVRNPKDKSLKKYYSADLKSQAPSKFKKSGHDWETIVGFGEIIQQTKDGKSDLLDREKHKLDTKKWTPCFNFRWIVCGAAGKLPRQRDATNPGLLKVVTTDSQLEQMVDDGEERVTLFEVCALKVMCPVLNDEKAFTEETAKHKQPKKHAENGWYRFKCDFDKQSLQRMAEK